MLGVRTLFSRQNERKGKGHHKEQSGLSTTGGHNVRAVVNVHEVNSEKVAPSVVPSTLQASVCDEQLMSIGGEIALSGNKIHQKKKNK